MGEVILKKSSVVNKKNIKKEKLNLILFLEGKLVSLLGTNLYTFVLSLYILKITGSGLSFAFGILSGTVPRIIFGPFAGVLADKMDRKKIVVLLDFLSGAVVFGMLFMSYFIGLKIVYIYVVTILLSIISTFFDTTISASIPNLVSEKNLTKINSYSGAISSLTGIIAPVIGGILYGLISINLFLLFNAASFVVSAISEMFINFELNNDNGKRSLETSEMTERLSLKAKMRSIWADIKEVFNFIKNKEVLYIIIKFALLFNFLNAAIQVVTPYAINNILNMSTLQFGCIETSLSVGLLLASIIVGKIPEREKKLKSFTIGIIVMGLCMIAFGIPVIPALSSISNSVYFVIYIITFGCFGASMIMVNIPLMVSIQKFTPDNIRGRVMGLLFTLTGGIAPLGIVLSGLVVDIIPPFILPVASGIIVIIFAILIGRNKVMKEF